MIITQTKGGYERKVVYKGFTYDFKLGGLHGCTESGVYESDEKRVIKSCDVASYYPNLAIRNRFYPEQFGEDFCDIYEEMYNTRVEAKKRGEMSISGGLKLSLTGSFGKSNDYYSPLYDPLYTMQTTINGQLSLMMLTEAYQDAGFQILMVNTDGVECLIDRSQEALYEEISQEWMDITNLVLEFSEYQKLVIRDINNYTSITTDEKIKPKGCFEIVKTQNGDIAYNKDWSMLCVPKALENYFFRGIPYQQSLRENKNIYDFCIGKRARNTSSKGVTKNWYFEARTIEGMDLVRQRLPKTIRYLITKKGVSLHKCYEASDGSKGDQFLEVHPNIGRTWRATLFNRYFDSENYDLHYEYYERECKKIIDSVSKNKQLRLL